MWVFRSSTPPGGSAEDIDDWDTVREKATNMINEQDAWLETLGVTGFKSSDDESSEADEAGATTDNGFDPVSGPDTDASEAEQPAQADVTVGGGPSSSKLLMDAPIGVLELISSSRADSTGRVFSVVVAS